MYKLCKRVFDIVASWMGIMFLLPVFIVIAVLISTTSRGGVLFKQIRVGKDGKEFKIWKFRTMIAAAEQKGTLITLDGDSRITKVGKFLRSTKIDELPQLFNVLFGQMSLVGPRPEVPKYVALYTEEQRRVLSVRPGITDLASIEYRDENSLLTEADSSEEKYITEIMPAKLALNLEYLDKAGFFYDIGLIFKTLLAIVRK